MSRTWADILRSFSQSKKKDGYCVIKVVEGVGINIQHGVKVTLSIKDEQGDIQDSTIKVTDFQSEEQPDSTKFYSELIDDLVYAKLLDPQPSFDISISLELPTSQVKGLACRQQV